MVITKLNLRRPKTEFHRSCRVIAEYWKTLKFSPNALILKKRCIRIDEIKETPYFFQQFLSTPKRQNHYSLRNSLPLPKMLVKVHVTVTRD